MTVLYDIGALLVLIGIMILIHELGHYWAARYFDVHIESFSIGFGPRIFGFRRGETDFRISLIPLGGYVKMEGEMLMSDSSGHSSVASQGGQPAVSPSDDPRAFLNKPRWQRLIIAFAGPFMNIVLAVVLLAGLYTQKYPKPVTEEAGVIDLVLPNSAAAKAGFQSGDKLLSIDGVRNPTYEDIDMRVITNPGHPIQVTYERAGTEHEAMLTPETDPKDGIGFAGWSTQTEFQLRTFDTRSNAPKAGLRADDVLVSVNGQPIRSIALLREIARTSKGMPLEVVYSRDGQTKTTQVQPYQGEIDGKGTWLLGVRMSPKVEYTKLALFDAVHESVATNMKGAGMIYGVLKNILIARMSPKSLEGPIRIAQAAGEAARQGADYYIGLMAAVSLNLALFNLLPIPVLDGGMILLLLVEMVWRRDLSLSVKENVMKFGFVFLMMLVMFVLYNDIRKTIGG